MQRPRWTKVRAGLDRYTSTLIDRFRSSATTTNRLRRRAGIAMPETLEPRIVLDSTVVFNEIMFHPDTGEETREWIELHNQMSVDIDLSGLRLSGGVKFDFADGTVLGGGDYLVIAASPEDLIAETGLSATAVLGTLDGRLDNAGETLRLRNRNDRIMDEIKYGDNDPWPPGADGGGVSLAKIDPNSGTEQISNWTISQQVGGTPGTTNFPGPPGPADLIFETVVPTGAPVKALVPSDGGLGTTWTARGFNDGTWTSGTTGVGFDSATTYDPFLGLDLDAPPNGQPPIRVSNNATVYMRVPFEFNSNPQQFDSIVLRMRYDDGFVAYINGVEVAHRQAPGRDGNNDPLVWNSRATANHIDGQAVVFEDFEITQFRSAFIQGAENILAIHGLNNGTGSTDLLFQPELVVGRLPGVPVSFDGGALKLNEVAPASAEEFWLELSNDSDQPLELGGVVIVTSGVGREYVLPSQTLSVGGLLLLTEQDLGFHPADGDKLFVYPPNKQAILDARVVTNRLRGRADEYPDRWLWPNVATRGAANRFDFEDQIVINEIMYHAAPQFETDTQPFAENDEEWVELYNRGSAQVDLAGWKLDDAMEFDFPIGTVLKPGEYLVVAKDAAALSAKYPGIAIVGDFSRSLSNSDDRILLVDANKNPADEVHYYERGKWAESADGGGSTLELRDPDADNNNAAAWAASDEAGRSSWQH